MYLINVQSQVLWTLPKTSSVVVITDLSVVVVKPAGDTSYLPIVNFVAPTPTTSGSVTYDITPDTEGIWSITLVKGASGTYTPLNKVTLFVFSSETLVNPISYSNGSLAL